MMRIMIILTPSPAHSDSVSCRGWGVWEGRDKGRALSRVLGPSGPCPWRCHLSPRSPKPWEPMSLMIVYAWSPVPLGVPSGFRAGWISGGASVLWRAGPLLPPAGLAGALLHRVGAKQGSEGAIG